MTPDQPCASCGQVRVARGQRKSYHIWSLPAQFIRTQLSERLFVKQDVEISLEAERLIIIISMFYRFKKDLGQEAGIMRFSVNGALLRPRQVVGVVERRQTLPVLPMC